jgi:hypothetical protein
MPRTSSDSSGVSTRGWLVEDHDAPFQEKLLQDLDLLLLAGREAVYRRAEVHAEGHARHERREGPFLTPPVQDHRDLGAREDEVL